jgi:hypothetical protein
LRRQGHPEAFEQQGDVVAGFRTLDQQQLAPVGGGTDDVKHLHGAEFLDHAARRQAAGGLHRYCRSVIDRP